MAQLCKKIGQMTAQKQQIVQLIAIRSSAYSTQSDKTSYKCVVLGGGTAGCALASKMTRKFGDGAVAVVEPHDVSLFVDCLIYCKSSLSWDCLSNLGRDQQTCCWGDYLLFSAKNKRF